MIQKYSLVTGMGIWKDLRIEKEVIRNFWIMGDGENWMGYLEERC